MERHAAGTFREDRRAKAALAELTHLAVAPANWLCSICRDVVQHDPVSLPCGHSYCRGCLMKVLADSSSQQAGNGSPGRGRCPMCRAVVPSADAVRPNDALRADLGRHSLQCTNAGCASQPVCARFWRQHQEECLFAEVSCKHSAHGCVWRGTRQALEEHLESCPFHALRSYLNKTNQQLHHLRHLCAHFEVALAHAGQQLAGLRQWRNGNALHAAEFLWSIFAEPHSYDTSVGRWRSSLDVVFLETLILSLPLFAVHAALATGALPASPLCRVFGSEVSPISGSDVLEQSCLLHVSVQHGTSAYLLHAACACALLGAVLYDGWASTTGWRLPVSQLPVMLYAAAVTPVLLADLSLLCAVVGFYTLQFALEAITGGQHRFLSALQVGSVLSACYISPLGTPKVMLASAAWLCYSIVLARFHAARRALARPIRMWWDALPVLQAGLNTASKADAAVLVLCAALSLVTLGLSEPEELCSWFGNLLLVLWGGAFGLRFAASSLLQLSLDTRGKNALASLCCRCILGCAALSAVHLTRRCYLAAPHHALRPPAAV